MSQPGSSADWPNRSEWARARRTVFADNLDAVTTAVSADPTDYATTAEITQAAAEIGDYWRHLGQQLREANQAALTVWPLHGHRARRRASIHALLLERDRLTAADKAVVEQAEALRHHRRLVNDAGEQLHAGQLRYWTTVQVERRTPRDTCPTWYTIIDRWRAAGATAVSDYADDVQRRPVDESAWRRELARRLEIEAGRLSGNLRRRR